MGRRGIALGIALAAVAFGVACQISPKFAGLDQGARSVPYAESLRVETLANGMRVAVVPDLRTNLVTVDVRYEVGASDDPAGRAGMAHYAEHVMWEAGVRGGPGMESLVDATLFSNASTTHSATQFTSIALDVELGRALEIEARRLEIPCITLRDDLITRERDVVIEEMKLRTAQSPAMDGLAAAVWGAGHPFGRSASGVQFADAPMTELCAFISGHYVPRAATLVVTGNVDVGVIERIRTRFERIPDRPLPGRTVLPRLPAPAPAPIVVAGLARPTAMFVMPVPPAGGPDDVLVEIAAQLMREKLNHAGLVSADAFVLGDHRARVIVAHMDVEDASALAVTGRRLRDAITERHADYDITDLQRDARTEFATNFDRVWDRGARLAELVAVAHPVTQFRRLQQIDALSYEEVTRFVRGISGRVVTVVPASGDRGATGTKLAGLTTHLHRVDVARSAVDPRDASAPLPLPTSRVSRQIHDYELANGLRVVLAPDPQTIAFDARLVFPVGTDHDPGDQQGRAAIAAQVLDPADGWDEGEYESRLVRWYLTHVGRRPTVDVSPRSTVFRVTGLGVFADWHVWNVAWTVLHGTYSPNIDRLKKYWKLSHGRPRSRRIANVHEVLDRLLGADGSTLDIAWVTRGQLERYRRAAYVPANATLIVSGNFDVAGMRREIETLFTGWPPGTDQLGVSTRLAPRPTTTKAPSYVAITDPDAIATQVLIAYVPKELPDDHTARAARDVLSAMLHDRMRIVREGMGVSYGIHGSVGARTVLIAGSVHNAHVSRAVAVIDTELGRLRTATADELATDFARARRLVLGRKLADPNGAIERAEELQSNAVRGASLDDTDKLVTAVRMLTVEDVLRAAAELTPAHRIVIARGPKASAYAVFDTLSIPPARVEWTE